MGGGAGNSVEFSYSTIIVLRSFLYVFFQKVRVVLIGKLTILEYMLFLFCLNTQHVDPLHQCKTNI